MKKKFYCWCIGMLISTFLFLACSEEEFSLKDPVFHPYLEQSVHQLKRLQLSLKIQQFSCDLTTPYFNDGLDMPACQFTDFARILLGYFESFFNDKYFDFELAQYYTELHRKYVTHYRGENYYGANGEYDQLAAKRMRELTSFWNLDRKMVLNGQHTASLDDREILTDMIESFDRSVRNRTEAYRKADELLEINMLSPSLPESPYFAMDAFTLPNGLLVIGDGLIETLIEAGTDGQIAFSAILAHEWWHQAQYENAETWTEIDEYSETWQVSRFIELEADYAAAYFLTHKRGATYNWKKIEEYFRLSFNVGDCLMESNTHHGTPTQRMNAAELGFELASSEKKKGMILRPDEVHAFFIKNLDKVLDL
ncbi:neutral zinc metallopeptidase [Gramella jeungdoensis]|uniref:Neutral zinc metallopeptidase n=1 Tax=Gramella jeungdoensis TaxID=708091 RepID=A0ABT0YXE5_9FLAO|nr:neutral zinc metallopeptidase [Gramella jeungdoensis]MCM8568131.1 neutral zinc metallopeptidase [Gramella jeungdoensis]